jgi:hypothetical protein
MRGELASRGLEGVAQFSWRRVADRLLEIYQA